MEMEEVGIVKASENALCVRGVSVFVSVFVLSNVDLVIFHCFVAFSSIVSIWIIVTGYCVCGCGDYFNDRVAWHGNALQSDTGTLRMRM